MSSACSILPRVGRECFRKLRMHHAVKMLQFAPAQYQNFEPVLLVQYSNNKSMQFKEGTRLFHQTTFVGF